MTQPSSQMNEESIIKEIVLAAVHTKDDREFIDELFYNSAQAVRTLVEDLGFLQGAYTFHFPVKKPIAIWLDRNLESSSIGEIDSKFQHYAEQEKEWLEAFTSKKNSNDTIVLCKPDVEMTFVSLFSSFIMRICDTKTFNSLFEQGQSWDVVFTNLGIDNNIFGELKNWLASDSTERLESYAHCSEALLSIAEQMKFIILQTDDLRELSDQFQALEESISNPDEDLIPQLGKCLGFNFAGHTYIRKLDKTQPQEIQTKNWNQSRGLIGFHFTVSLGTSNVSDAEHPAYFFGTFSKIPQNGQVQKKWLDRVYHIFYLIGTYIYLRGFYRIIAENERKQRERRLLQNLSDTFNHAMKRNFDTCDRYKEDIFQEIDAKSAGHLFFDIVWQQIKEAQSNLYNLSSEVAEYLDYSLDDAFDVNFKGMATYFYFRKVLGLSYTKVFNFIFNRQPERFESELYNPLMDLIRESQYAESKSDWSSFFKSISVVQNSLKSTMDRFSEFQPPEETGLKPFLTIQCPDQLYMKMSTEKIKSFWGYWTSVMDEIFKNSFEEASSVNFELEEQGSLLIVAQREKQPRIEFKDRYEVPNIYSLIEGDEIQPIRYQTAEGKISYGIFGLKIAADVLRIKLGIGYLADTCQIIFRFSPKDKKRKLFYETV